MSSLWDVPAFLVMAFSLALDAPADKVRAVSSDRALAYQSSAAPLSNPVLLPEQAWLRAVKAASPHSDVLARYGARIFSTSSGFYYVPSAEERADILALQKVPDIATRVLAAATITLKDELSRASGHEPTRAALLVAHLYGTASALAYMRALDGSPRLPAIAAVPQLADAWGPASRATLIDVDARISAELTRGTIGAATKSIDREHFGASLAKFRITDPKSAQIMMGTLTRPEPTDVPKVAER